MPDWSAFTVVDWNLFAMACIVVAAAALLQSMVGIGFGMVAAPVLAIIDPVMVPGPLLAVALAMAALMLAREWHSVDREGLVFALMGRIPMSFLAGLTAGLLSPQLFMLVFAAIILVAVGLSLSGWRLPATRRNLLLAGGVSGYMGTITSVGAPPMAIVYQHAAGPTLRATMGAYFVIGTTVSIAALALFGQFDLADLSLTLKLVPALFVGFFLSRWFVGFADRGWLRGAVLTICVLSSVALIAKSMM